MARLVRYNPGNRLAALYNTNWNVRPVGGALDILNNEDHFEVQMDLPGIAAENINVEVKDEVLTIAAKVNTDETREADNYTYRERYTGSYQRSLRLPENVDAQNIEAKFENGVLTVQLPKLPEAQPIRIAVKGVAETN